MGIVFGKIPAPTPKHEVIHSTNDYEIRKYPPSVVAEVAYDPAQFNSDKDGGFTILGNYIGAIGKPQNQTPEPIAMTAPVITKAAAAEKIAMTAPVITKAAAAEKIAMTAPVITKAAAAEKIAMTAPVITKAAAAEKIAMTAPVITKAAAAEKIAMTAPVITKAAAAEKIAMTAPVVTKAAAAEKIAMTAPVVTQGGGGELVIMTFILPSKYVKAEEAPRPVDERVVIREEGEKKYGVVRFSGVARDEVVAEKAEKLKGCLERDGFKVAGDFVLARYNPPFTLPPFRTNEVMIPVE